MNRAVLDANVWVSAAIVARGKPDQIVRQHQRFFCLTSEFILAEVADVLTRKHIQKKYRITQAQRTRFISRIRSFATVVLVKTVLNVVKDDAKDNPVLACAVDGQADYIVTGDDHLLKVKKFAGVEIVSPEQFLRIINNVN